MMPVGIARLFSVTVAIEVPPVEWLILDSSNKNYSRYLIMQQLTPKTSPRSTEAFGHLMGGACHAHPPSERPARGGSTGSRMSEYEVLFLLSRQDDHAMRRIDLSREVRISPSASHGCWIAWRRPDSLGRRQCAKDARVTYAVLTDAGMKKLRECSPAHLAEVGTADGERLSEEEIESLSALLGRLSDLDDDCSIGD